MTEAVEAVLGWGLFNVLLALIIVVPCLFDDRLNRGRWHGALRRLAPLRAPESRVLAWEPFAAATEEPRVRDARPRD
jgi:hypothetical protein